ncbi:MAG: hypothetical protein K1X28_01520 [Parachlamydiales bacterium]|nr:hypothetical protein [Parachlamydiales bacterium]
MTTQAVQTQVASVAAQSAPAEQKKVQDSNGRVIEPFRLHYDNTKAYFNAPATSENSFVAALQKTAYVAASAILAVVETLRNIVAGLVDVAFIAPVNFVGSFFNKTEEKPVEQPPAPPAPPAPQKPVELTRWQKFQAKCANGLAWVRDSRPAIMASNAASYALGAVKANPRKTVVAAASVAGTAAGIYLGVPGMVVNGIKNVAGSVASYATYAAPAATAV